MERDLTTSDRSSSLLERNIETPLYSLHREMNRLIDDVFHGRANRAQSGTQYAVVMPSIDVSESDKEMRVSVDLPGVREGDVDVSLVDDILTIRAERMLEKKDEKERYHVLERSYGTFLRTLHLPYSVDYDKIRADFDGGVLTVTLPKCKGKETARKIPVQSGREQRAAPPAVQPVSAEPPQET